MLVPILFAICLLIFIVILLLLILSLLNVFFTWFHPTVVHSISNYLILFLFFLTLPYYPSCHLLKLLTISPYFWFFSLGSMLKRNHSFFDGCTTPLLFILLSCRHKQCSSAPNAQSFGECFPLAQPHMYKLKNSFSINILICSYQLNIWYGFKWTPEY